MTTQKCVGITLNYNNAASFIDISISGYVKKDIQRFKQSHLKSADSQIIYVPPKYGSFQQKVSAELTTLLLTAAETLELQEIVSVFLFYARAVDQLMLTDINKIVTRQAKPTSLIKTEIERFVQCANMHHDATLRIRARNNEVGLPQRCILSRAGSILLMDDCAPGKPLTVLLPTSVSVSYPQNALHFSSSSQPP